METYNYLENVKEDVKTYIENEVNTKDFSSEDELSDFLNDTLWAEDSVTGNASGSYTFNTWQAEENLCHNLDLLAEAGNEFCESIDILSKGAEACDVIIRCYLLSQAISEVLEENDFEYSEE